MIHTVPILRDNYCYVLEGQDSQCLIIDPGEAPGVERFIAERSFRPVAILNTHHHADHTAGNAQLKKLYRCHVWAPSRELARIPAADNGLDDVDTIDLIGIKLHVLATPGHTKGHIAFYWEKEKALFSGDTLFSLGCGRLFEGSAEDMFHSLGKIRQLPGDTKLYGGHEYTAANGDFALTLDRENTALQTRLRDVKRLRANGLPTYPVTLQEEMRTNPFLMADSINDFADLRARKDNF